MTVRTAQTAKTSHRGSERPAWGRHRVQKDFLSGGSKGDRLHRSYYLGTSGLWTWQRSKWSVPKPKG